MGPRRVDAIEEHDIISGKAVFFDAKDQTPRLQRRHSSVGPSFRRRSDEHELSESESDADSGGDSGSESDTGPTSQRGRDRAVRPHVAPGMLECRAWTPMAAGIALLPPPHWRSKVAIPLKMFRVGPTGLLQAVLLKDIGMCLETCLLNKVCPRLSASKSASLTSQIKMSLPSTHSLTCRLQFRPTMPQSLYRRTTITHHEAFHTTDPHLTPHSTVTPFRVPQLKRLPVAFPLTPM